MKRICYISVVILLIAACKKEKHCCAGNPYIVIPFLERYGSFFCGANDYEYTYIFREKEQIDSFSECTFSPPIAFPIDETDMVYIAVGRLSYYQKDTMSAKLYIDSCSKKLTYNVEMIQRDTTKVSFYPLGATMSMFCEVENIPEDYEVEVKYKYVPLE